MSASFRYRVDLAYDGTAFAGWQRQPDQPTVQQLLEEILLRINGDRPVAVLAAGRTDSGTHARAQVTAFNLERDWEPNDLLHALHKMLPGDVRATAATRVEERFHPQRSALWKHYRYRIDRSPFGDPFLNRYAWHIPQPLDFAAMARAAKDLPGRHDWSGFTAAHCEVEDRVRTLFAAEPDRVEIGPSRTPCLDWSFCGEGFLTFMVRNIVGTLVEIGRGRFSSDRVAEVLRSKDRGDAGITAPANGLTLEHVEYDVEYARLAPSD